MVRVDLPSHTMWPGDASTTAGEVAEAVVGAGLVHVVEVLNAKTPAQHLNE
jgi:hypothetical protein